MRPIVLAAPLLLLVALLVAPAGAFAVAPGSVRAPAAPTALGIHPASAPPPFDWDQMWFNASTQKDIDGAGGAGAQLAVDDPLKIAVMFGGYTEKAGVTNDTWLVNQTTAVWSLLSTPHAPSPRQDFAMSSAPDCGVAVLFGGLVNVTSGRDTNDTWLFNFTTLKWTNITRSVGPAPRQGAALTVDDRTCEAVLFGGVDFDYHSGNSTGNVRWNDTWELGLANHTWYRIKTNNTPPSLTDAGFLYDNASNVFLLYGGCDSLCSPTIWEYYPANGSWTALPTPGNDPVGRGGMGWVYADTYDVAILSMGYEIVGNDRIPLNDTWIYDIGLNQFEPVGIPTPTPRYDAASGWLGANGCPGYVLIGGADAPTDPPDQWFMDPAPDVPLACNTWGNDSISVGGGGYSCVNGFNLTTYVFALNLSPVEGANVTAASNCSQISRYTGRQGMAYFDLTYQSWLLTVTAKGFHPNATTFQAPNTSVAGHVVFYLTPLPTLVVHTFEQPATGPPLPLGNVSISDILGTPIGTTDLNGSLVIPSFEPTGEFYTFVGNHTGFSSASVTSPVPYTGNWSVNLTLLAPGPIDVQVLEAGAETPLPGAVVTVRNVPTEAPAGFTRVSDLDGWANGTAVAGNFTATATLKGFEPFGVAVPFGHPWLRATRVTINLTSSEGYTVDVRVLNRLTHDPIPTATVQVGVYPPQDVVPSGWVNESGIKPAGTYAVLAEAPNFSSNRSSVQVSYYRPIWVFTLNLTPLTACSATNTGPNCTRTSPAGVTYQPLTLWPSSPPSVAELAGGGLLLLLVPAAFLWLARRRPTPALAPAPADEETT